MSKSLAIEVRRYVSSRVISWRMTVLLSLLLASAWWVSFPTGMFESLTDVLITLALLFEFRLWDDLSDVQNDRIKHPKRVLSRSRNLPGFWCLLIFIATPTALAVAYVRPSQAIFALGVLHVVLFLWYRTQRRAVCCVANYHVVLLKYPAIVFILGCRGGPNWNIFLPTAMASSYLTLCIHEVWHDDYLRAWRRARVMAVMEAILLVAILAYCAGSELRAAESNGSLPNLKSRSPLPISRS